MFVEEEPELELDGFGVVVVLLVVGVWDGSGVSDRVAVGVLVDVEDGTGGVEEPADVGAAEDELEGAGVPGVVWPSVGRCVSRLAALVPSRWASSAFAAAAAAAVFESWEAASALLRRPS
jgi:hypothetical protein